MAKEFSRSQRVGAQIQRELAELIQFEVKDPRVGLVTVSAVEVTRDMAYAKVFITMLDSEHGVDEVLAALNHAAGFLRRELGKRMKLRITPQLTFKKSKWGSLTITYSFYHGKYDDMSDTLGYAFQDQVLSGTLRTREVKGLVGEFGGVYYRSIRDQDLEKSNLNFGLMYTFAKTYHVEARYNVFNYDNFLLNRSYYTGNIVEVNLSKDITL